MPLLKCVTPSEAEYIMRDIYEGICRNHARRQSLAFKTLKQGYYWTKIKADYMEFDRKKASSSQRYPRHILKS